MGATTDDPKPLTTSFHERRQRERLADLEFEVEYTRSRRRIAQIDAVMQRLDTLRAEAGLSKAELARKMGKEPATVRRLFSSHVNPTLETVVTLADELGAAVQIVPAGASAGPGG
jgi:ribosome-binding protein aMBF1 (putative translation factor)